jgi:hypothetical protein
MTSGASRIAGTNCRSNGLGTQIGAGILLSKGDNVVERNLVTQNDFGVRGDSEGNLVCGNMACQNGTSGSAPDNYYVGVRNWLGSVHADWEKNVGVPLYWWNTTGWDNFTNGEPWHGPPTKILPSWTPGLGSFKKGSLSGTSTGGAPEAHVRAPVAPALMVDVRSAYGQRPPVSAAQVSIEGFLGQQKWTSLGPGLYGIDVPQGKYKLSISAPGYHGRTANVTVGPTATTVSVELSPAID